ncbi:MAG: S9 family peptidase [Ignavibacteria bacterium]|jgi:dipeptidyl-peptidase-4|nr:S9 family peptidase [Ignavibacteria bacterium]MCU7504300.1 S9 family peptidase [Ignavibacteria bacterium]MCU7516145.1 S9 family peptidase [Ignavibacteria bacterium]
MKKLFSFLTLIYFVTFFSYLSAQPKSLTVEDLYSNHAFSGNSLKGLKWFDNGKKFSYVVNSGSMGITIYEHDVLSGEEKPVLPVNDLRLNKDEKPLQLQNYTWSPDSRYILFTGVLPARRTKSGGTFYIYDVKNKKFSILAESDLEQSNARFSPDSRKVGFVRGNNMFIVDIATGREKQLTYDGSETILNGHFDWVYEEEFSIIDGWEWSPDSKSIAFWRLDQSPEPEVELVDYDSLYFNVHKYRYPKPGAKNAIVKIGVVNAESGKTTWMDLGREADIYIPRIRFTADPNVLSVQRLNRLQNHLELLFCNVNTGASRLVLEEKSPDSWIDVQDALTFLKDKKRFIWASDRDGFNHLYLYDYSGHQINQITKGSFVVEDVLAVDEDNQSVYYTSNERGRRFMDLYSVSLNGGRGKLLTQQEGDHSVNFSPDAKHFIDRYSNANTLYTTYLCGAAGEKVSTLLQSDMSSLNDYNISPVEFFTFKASDGTTLDASMIRPRDFDQEKKYPVIVVNYNGPGSKSVSDAWSRDGLWHQLLAEIGYIIVTMDCRITGGRNSEYKKLAYKNLGYWEVNDLKETAKYLRSLPYVDGERIGIWGWSYGGYSSASAILRAPEYYKAAIAVAPVTSWRFYDDIYTERYMSLPELNEKGYEESAVLNYAENLKGKFLLIHGMADDNVHFQNSVELVNRLIDANKQFRVMYYPGRDHSIYGGMTRIQLYNLMTDFFKNNL